MKEAHASPAAAPRKAYVPGVMHGFSGSHAANMLQVGWALWHCCE